MKSHLRHLLDKLRAHKPGLHSIILSPSGQTQVVYRFGSLVFETLDQLETWAYSKPAACTLQCHRNPQPRTGQGACPHCQAAIEPETIGYADINPAHVVGQSGSDPLGGPAPGIATALPGESEISNLKS